MTERRPEPRVKWAFPESLPASPMFTRVSGWPIRKPTIYGGSQPAYRQMPDWRGIQKQPCWNAQKTRSIGRRIIPLRCGRQARAYPIQPLTTCPEPHVKRTFPEGLPASPVFTRVSEWPIRKPTIYGGSRPTCRQMPNWRGIQRRPV